jgi:hypothetical protein
MPDKPTPADDRTWLLGQLAALGPVLGELHRRIDRGRVNDADQRAMRRQIHRLLPGLKAAAELAGLSMFYADPRQRPKAAPRPKTLKFTARKGA